MYVVASLTSQPLLNSRIGLVVVLRFHGCNHLGNTTADGQDNVIDLQKLLLESLFLDKIGADAKAERMWLLPQAEI